jgi:hypothetical protein
MRTSAIDVSIQAVSPELILSLVTVHGAVGIAGQASAGATGAAAVASAVVAAAAGALLVVAGAELASAKALRLGSGARTNARHASAPAMTLVPLPLYLLTLQSVPIARNSQLRMLCGRRAYLAVRNPHDRVRFAGGSEQLPEKSVLPTLEPDGRSDLAYASAPANPTVVRIACCTSYAWHPARLYRGVPRPEANLPVRKAQPPWHFSLVRTWRNGGSCKSLV